jgi:hypothetical protein
LPLSENGSARNHDPPPSSRHRIELLQHGMSRETKKIWRISRPIGAVVLENVRERFVAQGLITAGGSQRGEGGPPAPAKSPNFS